jgi:hypothetical protein
MVNQEKFQFIDFIARNWKYYTPIFGFLGLVTINQSGPLYTLLRLFFLACSVVFLVVLYKKASDEVREFSHTDESSIGELHLFCVFQVLVILVLIYNEVKPNEQGVTTVPSFLLCLMYVVTVKLLTWNGTYDKSRLISWMIVSLFLSLDLFLVAFFSVLYLKDHTIINTIFDAALYYWASIVTLSMTFVFIGGLSAYATMFSFNYQSVKNIRSLDFLLEENVPQERILLNITAGFTLLLTIVLIPILYKIIFHPI